MTLLLLPVPQDQRVCASQPVPETNTIINHGGLDEAGAKEIVKRQDTQELETNAKIENSLTRELAPSLHRQCSFDPTGGNKTVKCHSIFLFYFIFFFFLFWVFGFPARTKFGIVTKLSFLFL